MIRRLLILAAAALALSFTAAAPAFAYGPTGGATVTASSTTVAPGQPITISGTGFAPNESISIVLHSAPVQLATVQADSTGAFTATVTIPASTPPGQHTIVATGLSSGVTATFPITVTGSSAASGTLPFTGSNVATPVATGAAAVALGGLVVLASRKRRSRNFS